MTDAALLSDEDVGLGGGAPPASSGPPLLSDEDVGLGAAAKPESTMSSLAASPAIGFNSSIKSVMAAPGDLLGYGLSKLTGNESYRGAGTRAASAEMGAVGVDPDAPQHQPRSQLEKIMQAGGAGAGAMLLPEAAIGAAGESGMAIAPRVAEASDALFGSTSSPVQVAKNAAIGAGSSGASEAAGQNIGDDHPYWQAAARLGAGLVGGVGTAGLTESPALLRAGKDFIAPMTKSGQEGLAGKTLSDSLTNRAGTMDALDNAPQQLVPGSNPTTFQLTGDMGLGSLERQAATKDPAAFNQLRSEQNQARVDALGNIQTTGSPEDVSAQLRSRLNDLDTQAGDIQNVATQRAQTAASDLGGNQSPAFSGEAIRSEVMPQLQQATQEAAGQVNALGGTGTPEGYGSALRDPLQVQKDAARQQRSALYKAIDPDNSLSVVASPVQDAAETLYGSLPKTAAPPAGEEAAIKSTIQGLPSVVPFNDLQALDTRITAAMSAERRAAGETPVWGRLTQLKSAVSDAIDNGVANQIAHERNLSSSGLAAPADTIESRLGDWERDIEYESQRTASGAQEDFSQAPSATNAPTGLLRTAGQTSGGFGNPTGSQGIPKGIGEQVAGRNFGVSAPVSGSRPIGLMEFLAKNGGLKPDNELKSVFGGTNPFVAGSGRIVRKSGMSLDKAHEAAVEAGYIHDPGTLGRGPLETTYNDLLDKIAADHQGAGQYPIGTNPELYHEPLQLRKTEGYVRRELSGSGIDVGKLDRRLLNATIDRVASGENPNPADAFEKASIEYHNKLEDESFARGQRGASYHAPSNAKSELQSNFDPAVAQRLAAAKQAHIDYADTYKKGPVGNVLKSSGFGYKTPDAAVPSQVFAPGPSGFEKAMAYRTAVKNDPAAISAMSNYAASTLRKVAERPDGTIDPGKFSSWKTSYGDAMRAFPELAQRFSTAAKASEALTRFAPFRADMAPSQVPEMFFHSGPSGSEGVANLRRLIGDKKAQSILSDYAAAKLRTAASDADGTLNPSKVATFQKAHGEALKAFPELNAKFATAAKASETVAKVAQARKAAIDTYQAGAIGRVMKAAPEDVTKNIGSVFGSKDAAAQMGRLAREAAADKTGAATAGLRKGIAEFINSKFISNTEAGTSGKNLVKSDAFQSFLRHSESALAKAFTPEEISSMKAIAADLHRANRSVTAVKLPGQSNTAQDTHAVASSSHGKQAPLLREAAEAAVAGHALGPVGSITAAVGAVGKHVLGAMRSAGYAKVDDLVKDALLHPELAKALLKNTPMRSGVGSDISLAQQIRRMSVFNLSGERKQDQGWSTQ